MQRVALSPVFKSTFRKAEASNRDRVLKAIEKFLANPGLPGLNLEKLKGHDNLWTIRVSGGDRILMSREADSEGDVWLLRDFGPHDSYRRW